MGFFTRRDKPKAAPMTAVAPANAPPALKQPPASLFAPPNVYVHYEPFPKDAKEAKVKDGKTKDGKSKKSSKSSKQQPSKSSRTTEDRRERRDKYAKQQPQQQLQLCPPPPPQQLQLQYHNNNASMPNLHHSQPYQQPPIIVNQHYYLGAPPPLPSRPHANSPYGHSRPQGQGLQPPSFYAAGSTSNLTGSMVNLVKEVGAVPTCGEGLQAWYNYGNNLASSTAAVCEDISSRLNHVMTMIDGERLAGDEMELFSILQAPPLAPHRPSDQSLAIVPTAKPESDEDTDRGNSSKTKKKSSSSSSSKKKISSGGGKSKKEQKPADVATSVVRGNYFSKVEFYANSRLPDNLTPFAVYVPTWPLLCLAAQYSQAVYEKPRGAESEAHVSPSWRTGAKAMCIKSVPMDHMNTIVFAIRGTSSFMDWAVNFKTAPVSPKGLLEDEGNLCHAGFLDVARRMVKPVAARLRQLLHEDPGRSRYSLLITGHSAGGAVASLLYSHMLAQSRDTRSELNELTARFRRVHCVTFGTPPLSLLPLQKPNRPELRNSLFLSFVNEGDPVVRADKAYVKSLLELLAAPPPESQTSDPSQSKSSRDAKESKSRRSPELKTKSSKVGSGSPPLPASKPVWPVPPAALSNAGRLVVLRSARNSLSNSGSAKDHRTVRDRLAEGVTASFCSEEQLRGVIWGDPVSHVMGLYAGRVEALAVHYVTAKGY
jgi:hypothetical protein